MLTEYFRQEPRKKGRNCLGSACSSTTAKGFRGRYHLRNKKEQHSAARIGKSRQNLRHFRLLEALYCHISGQKRRTDIVTEGKQVSPSAEEIFPLSVRSEQDFAPTGKPQRNPQTTEKEAFSEMPRKGFRIGERVWLIREMLSVRIIRPVIRRKGKSTGSTCLYQSSSPFAAPVATVSGEKSIRRKSPIRKNTDSFLFSSCIPAVFFCNSL